jgi:hypothetical protein
MKRILIAALFAVACGGSSNEGGTNQQTGGTTQQPPPSLDSNFSGTWNGTTTLTFTGNQPSAYASRVVVAVSGTSATLADVCPDGSGTITVTGSGESASWSGTLNCPSIAFTNCAAVAFTYHTGSMALNGNGSLTVQGTGLAAGCGVTLNLTTTFVGTKG